jgi:predicted nucleic acid-binding protein
MSGTALIDASALVAMFNRREAHHHWASNLVDQFRPPWWTCEPVITEAAFLLASAPPSQDALLEMVERKALQVSSILASEMGRLRSLMSKYRDLPMSLADACLVCMAELNPKATVLTLDRHFTIYRKTNRQVVPTFMPA